MKTLLTLLNIVVCAPLFLYGQTATTWRGPNQSGVYAEQGLLEKWPDSGPEILWNYDELGIGYSSPVVANDRIFLSGMEGDRGYIYCLSEKGELLWKAQYGLEWDTSYDGSRASPVVVEDQLFMLSGTGDLACMSSLNGAIKWNKNIFNEFGGRNIQWGINETVVIYKDLLICTPGGSRHNIIALNRSSGELVWSTKGKGERSAYCTPLLMQHRNKHLIITHTENHVIGVDADTGSTLWSYPHTNRWSVHPNTPIFQNDQVFAFSGYGQGGVMLQLASNGSSVSKKWVAKSMDSRMGGAVVLNGKIYGSGDNSREWQCIDWNTGKVDYTTKAIGNGVVIAADNKLYFYSQRGEIGLVKPGTSSFQIVSKARVSQGSGQHWAHPLISKGILYVRHGDTLIAYKIK